jgi:hypothetical protein
VTDGRFLVGQIVEVAAGGTVFYVELAEESDDVSASDGVGVVATVDELDLSGVRGTIEAIAGELAQAWEQVRPSEATVEFSLKVVGKTGKLTGLLVEGGAEAALKVSLTWGGGNGGG